jgi:lipoprotein-anchoring transpeptidase ErfK/SrfK
MAQSAAAMGRWKYPAIVTLTAMVALAAPTADAAAQQARPAKERKETVAPRNAGEPIMAIVSIKSQQVTFYDADGWILRAPVSTGTKGRETPAGVFAVVEKKEDHRSNMYDDAWMPHMHRITWNGIALHGGPLPGYAASHGCVRMPFGFAQRLFGKTRIGMRVIISPNDAEPVELSHPVLFMPKAEAVAAAPARGETLTREAAEAAKAANAAMKAAGAAVREAAALAASLRKLTSLKARADADLTSAEKVLAAAKTDQAKARAEERKQKPRPRLRKRGRSSTPQRPMRNRSPTRPPQRTPSRRPRPGRPPPQRLRSMRNSRSCRFRSTSAAQRRSFTCGATRTSGGRTEAKCSIRASRFRSRSAIPRNQLARTYSPRWRAATAAFAGAR